MRLYIAEKPSLAQVIAAGLGGGKRGDGCIQVNGAIVTWCFGHLYELAGPEHYDEALSKWTLEALPILPDQFKRLPRNDAKKQIGIIKKLLKDASEVVNAGDPDREGQLLVDELLEELNWKGPTFRLWLDALDDKTVQRALASIKPNKEFQGLKDAAQARGFADWTFGMNLTRAYTIKGRQGGYDGVLSVGRVQTPTLALVVHRDAEIDNFKPRPFFVVEAEFQAAAGSYPGAWQVPEDKADPEGRCIDSAVAEAVRAAIAGQPGRIIQAESQQKKKAAELPFSLSALQAYCSAKWGMSAQAVLDVAQNLYEKHKATSYPRTDCRYLSEGAFSEVKDTLSAIAQADATMSRFVGMVEIGKPPKCFDSAKITAHTAIIPTTQAPNLSAMSPAETMVYDAIRRRYLAQFLPPFVYMATVILTECAGSTFKTSGNVPLSPGWKVLLSDEPEPEGEADAESWANLPKVSEGEKVTCKDASRHDRETKPPARFTEGTLIAAMAGISRFVDDPEVKKRLKETAGIGTEATRAGIIETLKKRGYLETKGKAVVSSATARRFIAVLPPNIYDPATTATWEQALEGIAEGRITLDRFMASQRAWISAEVECAKEITLSGLGSSGPKAAAKTKAKRGGTKKGGFKRAAA